MAYNSSSPRLPVLLISFSVYNICFPPRSDPSFFLTVLLSCSLALAFHLSRSLCHLAASVRTGRLPLFMTADMWQFSFVNDKKCANYLSGYFSANQTLTSCQCAACVCMCVRVCVSVRVFETVGVRGKLDKCSLRCSLLLNFNHLKSFHKCNVKIYLFISGFINESRLVRRE